MSVRLAVRLDADLAPLRAGMAEAGALLDRFGGAASASGAAFAGLGDAAMAALERVTASARDTGGTLSGLSRAANDNLGLDSLIASSRVAETTLADLGRAGDAALAGFGEGVREAQTALADLERVGDAGAAAFARFGGAADVAGRKAALALGRSQAQVENDPALTFVSPREIRPDWDESGMATPWIRLAEQIKLNRALIEQGIDISRWEQADEFLGRKLAETWEALTGLWRSATDAAAEAANATDAGAAAIERAGVAATAGADPLERAGAAAERAMARLAGGTASGASDIAVSAAGAFGDLDEAGAALDATLRDLASGADRVSASLGEMGAAGAAAGGTLHGAVGALARAGPVGLVAAAGIGALTVALYGAYEEAVRAEKEQANLERALRSSGGAASLTAKDLQDHATALSAATLATRDDALSAGTALARFHAVLGDGFGRALDLTQDMTAALGGDLRSNAERLGQALDDPAKALDLLGQAGVRFSDTEKTLIRDLADGGRAFAAQAAILDALARDLGGAGAGERAGLIGRTRDLADAWDHLVRTITGSDSALGQAAAGIVAGVTRTLQALDAALDQSLDARIERLAQERDALSVQLSSQDFGISSIFDKGFWTNSVDTDGMKQRLEAVNRELADLEDQRRRRDLAEDIAAEERANRVRLDERTVLNTRLADLHAGHERRLADLTTDRVQKVTQWEEEQVRRLEGLRTELAERGGATGGVDTAIDLVHRVAEAERAQAAGRAEGATVTREAVDVNQRLIETLDFERDALRLTERERSVEQALRRLSAEATADQHDRVRELAGALYDEKQAADANARATETLKRLRRDLADINLSEGDRAAAQAVRQLGDNASSADKAVAALLARQIQDGREAARVIDGTRNGAERYALEMDKLNHLLQAGAIDHETWGRAAEAAQKRALDAGTRWQDGAIRGLQEYAAEAGNAARGVERLMTGAFGRLEDTLTKFVTQGKADFGDLIDGVIADFTRLMIRTTITGPLASAAASGLGSLFGDLFRADGGPVDAGRPYIVGERGWELFVPGQSGRIVPAEQVAGLAADAGGVTIVQHVAIDARGADFGVEARIGAALARNKEETVAAVFDRINRGGAAARMTGRR